MAEPEYQQAQRAKGGLMGYDRREPGLVARNGTLSESRDLGKPYGNTAKPMDLCHTILSVRPWARSFADGRSQET